MAFDGSARRVWGRGGWVWAAGCGGGAMSSSTDRGAAGQGPLGQGPLGQGPSGQGGSIPIISGGTRAVPSAGAMQGGAMQGGAAPGGAAQADTSQAGSVQAGGLVGAESMEAPSVLIVSPDGRLRGSLAAALRSIGGRTHGEAGAAGALRAVDTGRYDVALIDGGLGADGPGLAEARMLVRRFSREADPGSTDPWAILINPWGGSGGVIEAVRQGAADVLEPGSTGAEVARRVEVAVARRREAAARASRDARLRALCGRLAEEREALGGAVGRLCDDLLGAYRGLAEQLDDVALASELNGLLRQELDVESLLRTQLEFLLTRLGSMNAGIFLPSRGGEYTLGAYINYDLPRESSAAVLDRLADTVAPRFEGRRRVVRLSGRAELEAALGEEAGWLSGHSALIVACHDDAGRGGDDECLAVIVLFRRERVGFGAAAVRTLQIASDLFGQQMGRVIGVHHRHLPPESWRGPAGMFGGEDGADGGGEGPLGDDLAA